MNDNCRFPVYSTSTSTAACSTERTTSSNLWSRVFGSLSLAATAGVGVTVDYLPNPTTTPAVDPVEELRPPEVAAGEPRVPYERGAVRSQRELTAMPNLVERYPAAAAELAWETLPEPPPGGRNPGEQGQDVAPAATPGGDRTAPATDKESLSVAVPPLPSSYLADLVAQAAAQREAVEILTETRGAGAAAHVTDLPAPAQAQLDILRGVAAQNGWEWSAVEARAREQSNDSPEHLRRERYLEALRAERDQSRARRAQAATAEKSSGVAAEPTPAQEPKPTVALHLENIRNKTGLLRERILKRREADEKGAPGNLRRWAQVFDKFAEGYRTRPFDGTMEEFAAKYDEDFDGKQLAKDFTPDQLKQIQRLLLDESYVWHTGLPNQVVTENFKNPINRLMVGALGRVQAAQKLGEKVAELVKPVKLAKPPHRAGDQVTVVLDGREYPNTRIDGVNRHQLGVEYNVEIGGARKYVRGENIVTGKPSRPTKKTVEPKPAPADEAAMPTAGRPAGGLGKGKPTTPATGAKEESAPPPPPRRPSPGIAPRRCCGTRRR